MYVEGFITLTASKGTDIDMSVPFLSFYGDWTKAPLFDLDYYATNADELDGDELLPQAVDVVLETGMASVSMLQRRLKLGYARAARIVDEMEEKGIVGPFQGSKPRNILITKEQWESMKGSADTQMSIEEMDEPFTHEPEDF